MSWDCIREMNQPMITVVPKGKEEKGAESLFKEITSKIWGERSSSPRHNIIEFSKIGVKETILKQQEEKNLHIQRNTHRLLVALSAETLQVRMEWDDIFKGAERNISTTKNTLTGIVVQK